MYTTRISVESDNDKSEEMPARSESIGQLIYKELVDDPPNRGRVQDIYPSFGDLPP
jgi:hypothetical protein